MIENGFLNEYEGVKNVSLNKNTKVHFESDVE